jgi:rare lipoprotein A
MKRITILLLFLWTTTVASLAQKAEYGLASYYSDFFQGKPTASGELYDNTKLTGAHKTLPFGTVVKVTRTDNNKSVQIRINDRGPFISGRVIEMSREAANRIGLISDGSASVKVEVVSEKTEAEEKEVTQAPESPKSYETKGSDPEKDTPQATAAAVKKADVAAEKKQEVKKPAPATPAKEAKPAAKEKATVNKKPESPKKKQPAKAADQPAGPAVLVKASDYQTYDLFEIALKRPQKKGFGVQIASLSSQDALFRKLAELQEKWFSNILVSVQQGENNSTHYRVILGSYATEKEAAAYRDSLKKNKKISGFVVDLANLTKEPAAK